jgi:Tfp pilus assembly protein PilX
LDSMLTVILVIVLVVLLVLVGVRGLGGRARMSEQVSDRSRAEMDRQFEKPPDEGGLF